MLKRILIAQYCNKKGLNFGLKRDSNIRIYSSFKCVKHLEMITHSRYALNGYRTDPIIQPKFS